MLLLTSTFYVTSILYLYVRKRAFLLLLLSVIIIFSSVLLFSLGPFLIVDVVFDLACARVVQAHVLMRLANGRETRRASVNEQRASSRMLSIAIVASVKR